MLLNKRSFGLNMVPGIEVFSSCCHGRNIFATGAFNNLGSDGIRVVVMHLETLPKSFQGEKP
jgi:hypothetical protein